MITTSGSSAPRTAAAPAWRVRMDAARRLKKPAAPAIPVPGSRLADGCPSTSSCPYHWLLLTSPPWGVDEARAVKPGGIAWGASRVADGPGAATAELHNHWPQG